MNCLLTVLIAFTGSFLFYTCNIPAGAMVGSLIFSAVFQITTGIGYFPRWIRIGVQAVAGGFIGQRINKSDLKGLKRTIKPSLQLFLGIVFFSFLTGITINMVSEVDIATALLSSVPGGMSDIAMISLDVGANPTQSTALQLVRYFIAILLLPQLAARICGKAKQKEDTTIPVKEKSLPEKPPDAYTSKNVIITLLIAAISGGIGQLVGFPAGAILFSMFAVAAFHIKTGKAYLPKSLRLLAQACAGAVIGTGVSMEDVSQLHTLLLPVLLVALNCVVMHYALAFFIYKTNSLDLPTSLFASIPAGLSDMALISLELGGDASTVMLLQLVRYVCVMAFMPTMIQLFAGIYPFV